MKEEGWGCSSSVAAYKGGMEGRLEQLTIDDDPIETRQLD